METPGADFGRWRKRRGSWLNTGVHGRRGLVGMVREPEYKKGRGTANGLVLLVREAKTVDRLVLVRFVPGGEKVMLRDKQVDSKE